MFAIRAVNIKRFVTRNILSSPSELGSLNNYYKDLKYQACLGMTQPILGAIAIIILKQILNGTNQQVALIQSGSMWGFLLAFIYCRFVSKASSQISYIIPHLGSWILIFLAGFWSTPQGFAWCVFAALFLFHISSPNQTVLYQQIYPSNFRGQVISRTKQLQLFSSVLVSLLIGSMIETTPEIRPISFFSIAFCGIICAFNFSTIENDKHQVENKSITWKSFYKVLQNKPFITFMILQFMLGMANIVGFAIFNIYLNDKNYLQLSPQKATIIAAVIPPIMMFSSIRLWGKIFDRVNIITYRVITSILIGVGFLLMPFAGYIGVSIGIAVWAIGRSGGQLAWTLGILDFTPPDEDSETYLAIHIFLTGVRGAIAPFIGVWLLDKTLDPTNLFLACSGAIFLSAILTRFLVAKPGYRS